MHGRQRKYRPDAADEALIVEIREKLARAQRSIDFITDQLGLAKKSPYYPKENEGLSNDILIGYDDFYEHARQRDRTFLHYR